MSADASGGAMVRATALDADIGRADDLDHRPEIESSLAKSALEYLAALLETRDEALVRHRLAFLEGLPAGQPPHPVFRDFHVAGAINGGSGGDARGKLGAPWFP